MGVESYSCTLLPTWMHSQGSSAFLMRFKQGKPVGRGLGESPRPLDYVSVQNWTWQQNIMQATALEISFPFGEREHLRQRLYGYLAATCGSVELVEPRTFDRFCLAIAVVPRRNPEPQLICLASFYPFLLEPTHIVLFHA